MEKQEFKVGDIVRIESDLSKYKGRTGTVVKYAGSRRRNLVRVRLRNGTETQFAECIEQNVNNHILASDTDIDAARYMKMHALSMDQVRGTNGKISFVDVLQQEKAL